jgi:hypothetical protein
VDIIAFWQVFVVLLTAVLVVPGLVVQAGQAKAAGVPSQPAESVAAAKA